MFNRLLIIVFISLSIISNSFSFAKTQEPEIFEQALKYHRAEEYGKSFPLFEKLAKESNSRAQAYLVEYYYNGKHVKQDYEKAFYWAEKSAEKGDDYAQYILGNMYQYGTGVEKDFNKAFYWYEKAAEQNEYRAQEILGNLYNLGIGVTKNKKLSFYWLNKSFRNQPDKFNSEFDLYYLYKELKGEKEAVDYLHDLVKIDKNEIFYNYLYEHYEKGKGIKKDKEKAKLYLALYVDYLEKTVEDINNDLLKENQYELIKELKEKLRK